MIQHVIMNGCYKTWILHKLQLTCLKAGPENAAWFTKFTKFKNKEEHNKKEIQPQRIRVNRLHKHAQALNALRISQCAVS